MQCSPSLKALGSTQSKNHVLVLKASIHFWSVNLTNNPYMNFLLESTCSNWLIIIITFFQAKNKSQILISGKRSIFVDHTSIIVQYLFVNFFKFPEWITLLNINIDGWDIEGHYFLVSWITMRQSQIDLFVQVVDKKLPYECSVTHISRCVKRLMEKSSRYLKLSQNMQI